MFKDKEYFVENFAMLLGSGMDIVQILKTLGNEMHGERMKREVLKIREAVEGGASISEALDASGFFPAHAIALMKIGEQSGRLPENLKIIAVQAAKDRAFRSRALSAAMYPLFVLVLTIVIGLGISWFILPRLATVFASLRVELPLVTRYLIALGEFFNKHGAVAVPSIFVILGTIVFFLFGFSKTRIAGQWFLFFLPGIRGLIREVELARFGYILGTLLDAGLPIVDALGALSSATTVPPYKTFYRALAVHIEEGRSFEQTFAMIKTHGLFPVSVLQMIVSAEQSGRLVATLLSIGETYEVKSEVTTKNLTIVLEPILLVIVWLGVVSVALAVILPIYSLLSGITPQQ